MPQPEITQITPEIFRQALGYFQDSLIKNEQIINDLNVYPVPDSDTGTNALLTVKAGLAGMDGQKVGELAKSFAKSAAKLALGNSGVILSAYLTGHSRNLAEEVGLANWTQAK